MQLAKPAEKGSLLIPWVWLSYMRHLSIIWSGFTLTNWLSMGGSFCFNCHHPRVPSCTLAITRLRVGSTCRAWHQTSMAMQVTCWLPCTESRMWILQLYASMGLVEPLRAVTCMACTTAAMTWRWVSEVSGMHPGQGTFHKASASILVYPLCNIAEICSWPSCPPIGDSLHPAWPCSADWAPDIIHAELLHLHGVNPQGEMDHLLSTPVLFELVWGSCNDPDMTAPK